MGGFVGGLSAVYRSENQTRFCDSLKENSWMGRSLTSAAAVYAVLHIRYSRFWHKVLYDLGFVSTKEPFTKLINQGMILGEDGQKMFQSRGNVIQSLICRRKLRRRQHTSFTNVYGP